MPNLIFRKNFFTLFGGVTVSRFIPLIAAPLLTRLYNPEQFGVMTAVVGIATIVSVFATLRYEVAIMLPNDDRDGGNVLLLALAILLTGCAIMAVSLSLFGDSLSSTFAALAKVSGWLGVLTLLTFCVGLWQILTVWSNRQRAYGALAMSIVTNQAANVLVASGLGVSKLSTNGLVWGRVAALMASCGWLLFNLRGSLLDALRGASWTRMLALAKRHRHFPIFNVPLSALGTVARELPVIALLVFEFPQASGHFALVRGVMLTPVSMLSASLGQLFFREAAEHFGTQQLEVLTITIMRRLAIPAAPFLGWFVFWSTDLFGFVFGAAWRDAGSIAAVYAPVAFLFLLTSWPERLYEVAEKQYVPLTIEVIANLGKLLAVLSMLYAGLPAFTVLMAYAVVEVFHHAAYLIGLFKVARLPLRALRELFARVFVETGVVVACTAAAMALPIGAFWQALPGLALAAVLSVRGVLGEFGNKR
jgi:O-antigen/teichoic acid export membrane protein